MPLPKLFISHSSNDKRFARKLDGSLALHGLNAFLDEKSIHPGESIPDRVYSAIDASTHVLFVLSQHSANSSWVREEIASAKMRANSSGSPIIIPLLIENCHLPSTVAHIKYIDFIDWNDSEHYVAGLGALLKCFGYELNITGSAETLFYAANRTKLEVVELGLTLLEGYFSGAMETEWSAFRQKDTSQQYELARIAIKRELEDSQLTRVCEEVLTTLQHSTLPNGSNQLEQLKRLFSELIEQVLHFGWRYSDDVTRQDIFSAKQMVMRVAFAVRDLRQYTMDSGLCAIPPSNGT